MKILLAALFLGLLAMLVRVVTLDYAVAFPQPTPVPTATATPYQAVAALQRDMNRAYAASPVDATARCLIRLRDAGDDGAVQLIGGAQLDQVRRIVSAMVWERQWRTWDDCRTRTLNRAIAATP